MEGDKQGQGRIWKGLETSSNNGSIRKSSLRHEWKCLRRIPKNKK